MSLQADINWIQTELAKVTDPNLIDAFKSLLKYRKQKSDEIDEELKEILTKRALKAEEDIKLGKVYTVEESLERIGQQLRK